MDSPFHGVTCWMSLESRALVWLKFLLLFAECSATAGGTLYVERSPVDVTTFSGYIAKFYCVSHGDGYIFWFANGSDIFLLPDYRNISSSSTQRTDGESGENSTLYAMASELNNGTTFTCGVLDLFTNSIVNYSSPATLLIQGKPSPPHEVIVYLEDNTDIDEIMFLLQWSHSITLFDNMYNRSQISTLSYIVYGYFNDTKTLSDEPDIFYRNKTRALVHRVQLDAHDCRFKEALFSVSAEFEEVGEGAMSTPEKNVNSSDGKICSSGKQTKFTTNHVTVVVLVGTIIITLLLILLIVSIVLLVLITCHQRKKRQKVQINLQPTSTANINMDKNSAYELRNFRKGVLQCHPNSAYSSVGKYNKSHRSSIL